jgi:cbb3-type cytochrome oxidase subunit 3
VEILAQVVTTDGGSLALTLFALVGMIVPLLALVYVCWIFWKAKKREDAEADRQDAWRNAPSS